MNGLIKDSERSKVTPHVCNKQDANKTAIRSLRDIRKVWKRKKSALLSSIFSDQKVYETDMKKIDGK